MSYTTGTTHYNLPQTVGSDKRDWTDTNEAFSDVDAALWEAHQGATQAALDIASINSEIQTITGKQADDEADIATISGKVSTLETTVANHTAEIGDVRRDLQDNIESLREDTATSTHAYEIGDYFYYNDVLFKATAQIAIGATIVPNTNCTGVTVMDELKNGGGSVAAEDVSFDNTASGLTATDVQAAIDEVVEMIPSVANNVLYTNPTPNAAQAAGTITFNSTKEYNFLKVFFNYGLNSTGQTGDASLICVTIDKNLIPSSGTVSNLIGCNNTGLIRRTIESLTYSQGVYTMTISNASGTAAGSTYNDACVIRYVVGSDTL